MAKKRYESLTYEELIGMICNEIDSRVEYLEKHVYLEPLCDYSKSEIILMSIEGEVDYLNNGDLAAILEEIDDKWFDELIGNGHNIPTLREAMEETVSLSLLDYLTELYDV